MRKKEEAAVVVYGAKKGDKTLAMSAKHTSALAPVVGELAALEKEIQQMFAQGCSIRNTEVLNMTLSPQMAMTIDTDKLLSVPSGYLTPLPPSLASGDLHEKLSSLAAKQWSQEALDLPKPTFADDFCQVPLDEQSFISPPPAPHAVARESKRNRLAVISKGSVGHPYNCAAACKYVKRKGGCRDGADCPNCHECFWSKATAKEAETRNDAQMVQQDEQLAEKVMRLLQDERGKVDMNAQISQADMFGKDCVERPTGSCRPRQVPPMGFVDWSSSLNYMGVKIPGRRSTVVCLDLPRMSICAIAGKAIHTAVAPRANMSKSLVVVKMETFAHIAIYAGGLAMHRSITLRFENKDEGIERIGQRWQRLCQDAAPEVMPDGVQAAAMIDDLTSAVSLDRTTGLRSLHAAPVSTGLLMPAAYETLLEVRPRIRVLDHQAVVYKTVAGQLTVHTSSFFLAPFDEIFAFPWSLYQDYQPEPAPKISATILDLRVQRLPWRFLALTQDNVRLELTGNTFWQISNVVTMATATEDAPADVAARSRAEVLSRVAEAKYRDFMASLSSITAATTAHSSSDSFYSQRGLSVSRVEIIGYEAVDEGVAEVLRSTVVEVTAQVNRLIQAQTLIDVNASKMSGEIRLEKLRTAFITHKANNDLLLAMNEGAKEPRQLCAHRARGRREAVSRVDLYRQYHEQDAINELTKLFADGPSKFYLHANDTDLVLSNYRTEL
eukprot:g920.t1